MQKHRLQLRACNFSIASLTRRFLARRLASSSSFSKSKMTRILCVAEKPSISKAVAGHLSGGQMQTVR